MNFPMNQLYRSVGITKQAIHQYEKRQNIFDDNVAILIHEVDKLRSEHPGCGIEKMYFTLLPDFLGRDRFIELFMDLGYRIKRNKNYKRTTFSSRFSKYPNLIKGLLLHSPNQVWQSDITYIKVSGQFYYAVFIIDVYTKKIVGYNVSDSMRATANVKAVKMAIKENGSPVIHHSDKGSQYIYKPYLKLLNSHNTYISMGDTALDNAYAERINSTIKNEYLAYWIPKTYGELKTQMRKAVRNYNSKRVHNHLNRKTPVAFEKQVVNLDINSRPLAMIYAEEYANKKRNLSPLSFYTQQNLQAQICPIV